MTQRSMPVGQTSTIVIRGGSFTVEGWESDRVQANTDDRWGVRIEKRKIADIGRERARAAIGDRVLFDISFINPFNPSQRMLRDFHGEAIEVIIGHGQVRVPLNSNVVVYAGRDAEVRHLQGRVMVSAGRDLTVQDIQTLVHAAAGGDMSIDCMTLGGDEFKFSAGRDLRFYARDLDDAKITINEAGTYWEVVLGNGRIKIRLNAGGDATLITDREVQPQPPHYLLGNIERPATTPPETEQPN
ncbi:MAG TPA: hypothetical protein VMP08_01635 [Anaerolineae bacterium]|nr:hypothetical protein [Anaerolineae bacterium]